MNNRAFTISLVVAVLAVLMVNSYVSSTEEQYKAQFGEEITVVKAKVDIKELELLDDINLIEEPIPRKFEQPGAARKIDQVKGGLALGPIKAGEQITVTRVTKLGARTGLSQAITRGKRAVSLRVNDDSGVSKLVKPGDYVDVIVKFDTGGGKKEFMKLRTVLQGVKVIAVGKYVENTLPGILEKDPFRENSSQTVRLSEYSNFATVTVEVSPYEAQHLVFSERVLDGVYLTLRNRDDMQPVDTGVTAMEDVLGTPKQQNVNRQ